MPKIASNPAEAEKDTWNIFSLTALRRNQSYLHLDLKLLCETIHFSYLSTQFVALCYGTSRKLTYSYVL